MSLRLSKPRHWLLALIGGLAVAAVGLGFAIARNPDEPGTRARNEAGWQLPDDRGPTDDGDGTEYFWYYVQWGTNFATDVTGDECLSAYPTPPWALASYRAHGHWLPNVPAWHLGPEESNATGSVNLDFSPEGLEGFLRGGNALFYRVSFFEYTNASASLFLDLLTTNGEAVLMSEKNLNEASGQAVAVTLQIPLQQHPDVACLHLRAASPGPATVGESLLFVDKAVSHVGDLVEVGRWRIAGQGFDPTASTNDLGQASTNRPYPWPTPSPTNAPPTPTPSPSTNVSSAVCIYVNQALGSDSSNGRAPVLSGSGKDGPLKTIRSGMAAIRPETRRLIIHAGAYSNDVKSLNLRGRPIRLEIQGGRVRL